LEEIERRVGVACLLHVDPDSALLLGGASGDRCQMGEGQLPAQLETELGELHGDLGVETRSSDDVDRFEVVARDRLGLAGVGDAPGARALETPVTCESRVTAGVVIVVYGQPLFVTCCVMAGQAADAPV